MKHTVMLIQYSESPDSKTYMDYEDVNYALDGICQLYEQSLKASNPQLPEITYTVQHLFDYLDKLHDICVFVRETNSPQPLYTPHDRRWAQRAIFDYLRAQAAQR
eukprot:Protomagalhaensia_wolfi_Nauph_80__233@NODE_1130_length_1708_cov_182_898742_g862_i0_p2_GENE_NODE_1130_length_1708_cov_182_898742_g862_i0NODE_1130_length_1708_cov_182_898742_g862_i0_p2_ORF_typecomplete_len105_score9_76ER/PF01133_17/1_9e33_NODE_1130_length_1708_cov_182_898742_g862_i0331645